VAEKIAPETQGHDASPDAARQYTAQADTPAPAKPVLDALTNPSGGLSATMRSEAITSAQSSIGTARLNRLLNPPTTADHRPPGAQPVETLPAATAEAVTSPGSGQPLDASVRERTERSFGTDLSRVRVHSDAGAANAVAAVGARAIAHGTNVFLGAGEKPTDLSLMAHELAHTVQQDGQRPAVYADNGNRADPLEHEADHAAQSVQQGGHPDIRLRTDGPTVQPQVAQQDGPSALPQAPARQLDGRAEEAWLNSYDAGTWADKTYWMRVGLLESFARPASLLDVTALDAFVAQAEIDAGSEETSAKRLGSAVFRDWTLAFPQMWSEQVYNALHLADVDLKQLAEAKRERFDALAMIGAEVPPWVLDHGLPLTFDEAASFKDFTLTIDPVRLEKAPIFRDYLNALYRYMGAGGVLDFYGTWEQVALNVKSSIADGKQVVTYGEYANYVQNEKRILAALPARLKATPWNDAALSSLDQDVLKLADLSFVRAFASSLVGLFGMIGLGQTGRDLFYVRLAEVDGQIKALSGPERVLRAFTWAHEQGYFATAAGRLWQGIRAHGTDILKSVFTFIALQFIPVVDIAVDVALIVLAGVDILDALGDLTDAIVLAWSANDVSRLERAAPRVAAASVGDGFRIIIDLIGIAIGIRGVKARAAKLLETNAGLSEEEAIKQALREGAGKGTPVTRLTAAEEWLERNGRSALARLAIGLARGNVDEAQVVLQFLRGEALSVEEVAVLRRVAPDLAEVADTMASAARVRVSTGRLLEYLRDATVRAVDRTTIAQGLRRLIEVGGLTDGELNTILTHFARPADLAAVIRVLEEMHVSPRTIRDVLRTSALQGRTGPEIIAAARGAAAAAAASTAERIALFERAFEGRVPFRGGAEVGAVAEITIETPGGPRTIRITEYDLNHYRTGHTFENFSFDRANVARAPASTFWPPGTTPETILMQARLAVNEAAPEIARAVGGPPRFFRVPGNVTIGGYQYRVGVDLATGRLTQFFPEGGAGSIRVPRADLEAAAVQLRAQGRLP
jgi:hypothetical protein